MRVLFLTLGASLLIALAGAAGQPQKPTLSPVPCFDLQEVIGTDGRWRNEILCWKPGGVCIVKPFVMQEESCTYPPIPITPPGSQARTVIYLPRCGILIQ